MNGEPNRKIGKHYNLSIRKEYKKLVMINTKTQSWQELCANTETWIATARLNKLLCKSDQNKIKWIKITDGNAVTQPQDILSMPLDTHFPGDFQHDEDTFPLKTQKLFLIQSLLVNEWVRLQPTYSETMFHE